MPSLVILGASGFLGRTLISEVQLPVRVKAITRNVSSVINLAQENITWIEADISILNSLNEIIEEGDIVLNLAYISGSNKDNIHLIDNIISACIENKANRLVHCSTAVVIGSSSLSHITEEAPCIPVLPYEKNKWLLEQHVLGALSGGLDVGILRPTAIIGRSGKNLLKLAISLKSGNRIINYFRACLFGERLMHLVPVRDVAAALLHLTMFPTALNGNIYIISSDDDPNNNFKSVEKILLQALGLKPRLLPLIPLPLQILSFFLMVLGRSEINMARKFDGRKLHSIKFIPVDTVENAIYEFGKEVKNHGYEK